MLLIPGARFRPWLNRGAAQGDRVRRWLYQLMRPLVEASWPRVGPSSANSGALGPAGRLDPETSETLGPAIPRDLPRSILPEALHLRVPGEHALVGAGECARSIAVIPRGPCDQR